MMTKLRHLTPGVLLLAACGSRNDLPIADAALAPDGPQRPFAGSLFSRTAEVPVPAGTLLPVRLNQPVDTARNRAGDRFTATLETPVAINEKTVIPRGTQFQGVVTNAVPSGRLKGSAQLTLRLETFVLSGQTYNISTSAVQRTSRGHKKRNWWMIGGGSGAGAAIGAMAGGGTGVLIGAGAGAATGTAGALFTGRQNAGVPVEALVSFSLNAAVRVKIRI